MKISYRFEISFLSLSRIHIGMSFILPLSYITLMHVDHGLTIDRYEICLTRAGMSSYWVSCKQPLIGILVLFLYIMVLKQYCSLQYVFFNFSHIRQIKSKIKYSVFNILHILSVSKCIQNICPNSGKP